MTFIRAGLALLMALSLVRCVSYEATQQIPELTLSPERIQLVSVEDEPQSIDFGLEAGTNESDSLFNLETLPGIRVRALTPGGAAEAAGIRAGDVVLRINDLPTDSPDTLALLEQTAQPGMFEFTVRRDSTVFAANVLARAAHQGSEPKELYRIDPFATRAGYSSALINVTPDKKRQVAAATVVEIFDESPLSEAGIKIGDNIIALQGRELNSAQDLINRLTLEHELGDRVVLDVYDGDQLSRIALKLWHPGRRVSRISLGPVMNYEASLQNKSKEFTLLNLWLFSLYHYQQIGGERIHKLLGLFEYASDYGELIEEIER